MPKEKINVSVDVQIMANFRKALQQKYRTHRGYVSCTIQELIENWINAQKGIKNR